LNLLHIYPKKDKQLEIGRRAIMMSQFDDEEERETLLQRQRRQEDITMRGNVNPQQIVELLTKQH